MQIVQAISKIVTSVFMGGLIDRKLFKKGRFYPWLQISSVVWVLSLILLYVVPVVFPNTSVFVLIGMVLTGITLAMIFTAYNVIFPMITRDPQKRTVASSVKNILKELGKMAVGAVYPLMLVGFAATFKSEAMGYVVTASILGAFAILIFFWVAAEVKKSPAEEEDVKVIKQPKASLKDMMKALATNPALLIITLVSIFFVTRNMTLMPMAPYYFKYVVQEPKALALFLSLNSLVPIGFMLLTPYYQKLVGGTKKAFMISLVLCALSHVFVRFVGFSVWPFTIILSLGSGFYGWLSVLALNMFAVATDYGEWKLKVKVPGISMSLYYVAINGAIILATTLRTAGLKAIGYQAGMESTPELANAVLSMISYIPLGALVAALILMIFFPVSDKKHKEILSELSAAQ